MFSKKFGLNLIGQVSIKFLAIALGIYTTRWLITNLSPETFETYNLILGYNAVILSLVNFGLPLLVQKYYTNTQDSSKIKDFWTTFGVLRIITYFAGLAFIFLTFPLSQTNELGYIIGIFTAQYILIADLNYRSVCDSKGRSWQFSTTDFIGKLLLVILLLSFSVINFWEKIVPLEFFILSSIFSYLVSLAIDAYWQREYTGLGRFDLQIFRENLKPIFYLFLSTSLVGFYLMTDRIFLKYFGYDEFVVNGYSNAFKIFDLVAVVPGLTMPAIASLVKGKIDTNQPNMTTGFSTKLPGFSKKIKNTFSNKQIILLEWTIISLLLGLFLSITILIFDPIIIQVLDPNLKYPLTFDALSIMALGMIPMAPIIFLANLLVFLHGEKFDLLVVAVTSSLSILMYFLIIPEFGLVGASWLRVGILSLDICLKFFFVYKLTGKLA
jgi:hypothetical protein